MVKGISQRIEFYLFGSTLNSSTIALQGKEGFYSRYGYKEFTGSWLGVDMCNFI